MRHVFVLSLEDLNRLGEGHEVCISVEKQEITLMTDGAFGGLIEQFAKPKIDDGSTYSAALDRCITGPSMCSSFDQQNQGVLKLEKKSDLVQPLLRNPKRDPKINYRRYRCNIGGCKDSAHFYRSRDLSAHITKMHGKKRNGK